MLIFTRWIIWGVAALFYCYQFMLRVSPNTMVNDLMASFHVDACALGMLSGFYYYTYAALQIPIGTLMDRFKPRRMLTFASFICAFGTILFSSAESIYVAAFGRALIGAGSAFAFLSCLKLGTLWFPSHKIPLVVGMTLLLGTMGGSAGYPMRWLVELLDWRHALWLIALAGFGIAFLGWAVVRDRAPKSLEEEILKSHGDGEHYTPSGGILQAIFEVISKPQSWIIALYGFLMYIPLSGFADLWGVPFLISTYHVDDKTAAAVISIMYIGIGIGGPSFSFIYNYLKSYKIAILISSVGSLIFLSSVFYISSLPLWLLISLLFLSGFFLSGQFLGFSMTCTLNPLSASATAAGFHNMICMLSGVVFQPFIGWLLDYSCKGNCENQINKYTSLDFTIALTSIIVSLFISFFIILLIREPCNAKIKSN